MKFMKITYKYIRADEMSGKCTMHWDIRHAYKMLLKKAGRKVRNGLENLNVDGKKIIRYMY
jgi:hypothetical protein